jgi:hypothetical protein
MSDKGIVFRDKNKSIVLKTDGIYQDEKLVATYTRVREQTPTGVQELITFFLPTGIEVAQARCSITNEYLYAVTLNGDSRKHNATITLPVEKIQELTRYLINLEAL